MDYVGNHSDVKKKRNGHGVEMFRHFFFRWVFFFSVRAFPSTASHFKCAPLEAAGTEGRVVPPEKNAPEEQDEPEEEEEEEDEQEEQ